MGVMAHIHTSVTSYQDPVLAALRSSERPTFLPDAPEIGFVDLFAGGGILSAGADIAGADIGFRPRHLAFVERERHQTATYLHNFSEARPYGDVMQVAGGAVGTEPSEGERAFAKYVRGAGTRQLVIMGGPPCQGHSTFNNKTRYCDPKNHLYFTMARAAELLRPDLVVIENVQGCVRDAGMVVDRTTEALTGLGYRVSSMVLKASDFNAAQARKRYVMVGVRGSDPLDLTEMKASLGVGVTRPVTWALDDLLDADQTDPDLRGGCLEGDQRPRIDYLFDHDLYDLPNAQRSASHRNGTTYKSCFGRMHPDRPAPTLTTGFECMARGRFTHPSRRRTLSPREGLRLQTVPDWFSFPPSVSRSARYEIVGNGAPAVFSAAILTQAARQGILRVAAEV